MYYELFKHQLSVLRQVRLFETPNYIIPFRMQIGDPETHLVLLELAQFHLQRKRLNTKGAPVSHTKAQLFLPTWPAQSSNCWQTPLIIIV